MNTERIEQFSYWIRERESIRIKKDAGEKRLWSEDPIFNRFHFCNVHREDDRGTKELRDVVHKHKVEKEDLPWVYTVARLFNKASSLDMVLRKSASWRELLQDERARGRIVFHTAYVVSTCGKKMDKIEYVHNVMDEVQNIEVPDTSCWEAYEALRKVDGLGSFLAAQVVADLKRDGYIDPNCKDFDTFSVIGPGSKKGLDFIFEGGTTERNYASRIGDLEGVLPEDIRAMEIDRQDLQNCLCEFSKYMRHKLDLTGRKRLYA